MTECVNCKNHNVEIPPESQRTLEIILVEKDNAVKQFFYTAEDSNEDRAFTNCFLYQLLDRRPDGPTSITIRAHPAVKPTSLEFWQYCARKGLQC